MRRPGSDALDAHHRQRLALYRRAVAELGFAGVGAGTTVDGIDVGTWIQERRKAHARGRLPPWLARELEAIPGWTWARKPRRLSQEQRLAHGRRIRAASEPRHRRMLARLASEAGRRGWAGLPADLRRWVIERRRDRRAGALAPWLATALEAIPGFEWDPIESRILGKLDRLERFLASPRDRDVAAEPDLRECLRTCRRSAARGTLSPACRARLEALLGDAWYLPASAPRARRTSPGPALAYHEERARLLSALVAAGFPVDEVQRLGLMDGKTRSHPGRRGRAVLRP